MSDIESVEKPTKPKRVLSPERLEKLRLAREKAMESKKRNKEIKDLEKQVKNKEKDDKVYKMLDFKYSFYCDKNNNYPDLTVYLTPTRKYDKSASEEFAEFIAVLIIVIIIIMLCAMFGCFENNNHSNDGFWLGYILGSNNNNSRSRIYCE